MALSLLVLFTISSLASAQGSDTPEARFVRENRGKGTSGLFKGSLADADAGARAMLSDFYDITTKPGVIFADHKKIPYSVAISMEEDKKAGGVRIEVLLSAASGAPPAVREERRKINEKSTLDSVIGWAEKLSTLGPPQSAPPPAAPVKPSGPPVDINSQL